MNKLWIFLSVFTFLFLSSCGKDDGKLVVCTEEELLDSVKFLERYYKELYPEEEIEFENIALPSESEEREAAIKRLKTQVMTGEGPDIFIMAGLRDGNSQEDRPLLFSDVKKAMQSKIFLDLTPYLEADQSFCEEDYQTGILSSGMYEEKQYILPLSYTMDLMYINKDIAKSQGWSPESSLLDLEEYKRLSLDSTEERIRTAAVKMTKSITRDCLLSAIDYENQSFSFAEKDAERLLEQEKSFVVKSGQLEEGNASDTAYEDCYASTELTTPFLPGDIEKYKNGTFFLPKNANGKIVGRICHYACIGRGCSNPKAAYRYIRLFLNSDYQAGDYVSTEESAMFGAYSGPQQENIPVCKKSWKNWIAQEYVYLVSEEELTAYDQILQLFDQVSQGVFLDETFGIGEEKMAPLETSPEAFDPGKAARELIEEYDKTAKE